MDKLNTVYIALGSNMGNRYSFLEFAINAFQEDVNISIVKYSSVYETTPIGFLDQDDFLNMVIEISTSYTPMELLHRTQQIQNDSGRKYKIRWGPRTLDLDILLYNQENIEMEQLIVPHSRMFERGFVIIPLREINSNLYFPSIEKTIQEVYKELSNKEGVRLWKGQSGEDGFGRSEN